MKPLIKTLIILISAATYLESIAIAWSDPATLNLARQSESSQAIFKLQRDGSYLFDTGVLSGALCPGKNTYGLTSFKHNASQTGLSGAYGVLSYYRIFATNKRYGKAAWVWPSDSKILPSGAAQVFWPAHQDHPIEIIATYRWLNKNSLDLVTDVKAQERIQDFEVFLASYFGSAFPKPYVYVDADPARGGSASFLEAQRADGHWQLFPRDNTVIEMVHDGRWDKAPNPVKWVIRPRLAAPLCVRRNPTNKLVVALMAPPSDCFAISTPYAGEGHYSLYLSLFGCDLEAGQRKKARCRLLVGEGLSDQDIIEYYQEYIASCPQTRE
jgi:hypothetical protein